MIMTVCIIFHIRIYIYNKYESVLQEQSVQPLGPIAFHRKTGIHFGQFEIFEI